MKNKKVDYITGDLHFEDDNLFLHTIQGESILVHENDLLGPLVHLSDGGRQRAQKIKLKDLRKTIHRIENYSTNCYLFPGEDRKLVYTKDGIPTLIDCKVKDKVTIVVKYWGMDEGKDERLYGILKKLHDTYFIFVNEDNKEKRTIMFEDIRNLTAREEVIF